MRYADISSPTDASVPAVPSIPFTLRPGTYKDSDEVPRGREQPKEDTKEIELKMLDKDDFDPDACELIQFCRSLVSMNSN